MNTPSHNRSIAKQAMAEAVESGLAVSYAHFVADAYETLATRQDADAEQGEVKDAKLAAQARAAEHHLKRGRAADAMAFAYGFQLRWAAQTSGKLDTDQPDSPSRKTVEKGSPSSCPILAFGMTPSRRRLGNEVDRDADNSRGFSKPTLFHQKPAGRQRSLAVVS